MTRPVGFAGRAFSAILSLPTTTLEGRFFLVGVVAVGFLATATDRNYVLLFLGVLFAVVVVSAIAAGRNLRRVTFQRTLPRAVIAGEPFSVRVRLQNSNRWLPARGILVKDALQSALTGTESRCHAPSVPAGGRVTFVYSARIRRRGAYNITNALLMTRFPFGLFEKRVLAQHPNRIVVYPTMYDVAGERLPGSRDVHLALRERAVRRPGGGEFRSLRDYRPGDDPRRIAWRVTARQRRLVLKEMERENRCRVAVVLSTSLEGVPAAARRTALEQAVTLAASLVRHFHRERRPLLFAAPGLVMPVGSGSEALHHCLAHLATVRASPEGAPDAVLAEAGSRRLRGMDVILVTAGTEPLRPNHAAGYRLHPVIALTAGARRLLRRSE
jgi:uncharacterized protein (DUF58 family)